MFESVGGLTVDASSFVKVHKLAATLRVCLGNDLASCGSVSTAAHPGSVITLSPDNHEMTIFDNVGPGRYRVRVIIADSSGARLLDATTTVQVRHSDGISGCPNTATNTGSVTVEANGSLAAIAIPAGLAIVDPRSAASSSSRRSGGTRTARSPRSTSGSVAR